MKTIETPAKAPRRIDLIDLQDVLLAAGVVLVTAGVAAIYWPAALILLGAFFLFFSLLIEKARKHESQKDRKPE